MDYLTNLIVVVAEIVTQLVYRLDHLKSHFVVVGEPPQTAKLPRELDRLR